MKRRDFLKVVLGGATISLGAERQRFTKLIPFLSPPENVIPGVSTWFATSCRECPAGCGLLLKNRDGRVVKAEGNPLHPINQGKTCARGQAYIQGLYDPDRLTRPLRRDGKGKLKAASWNDALKELGEKLAALKGTGRVAVISDLQTGSLAALIRDWLGAFGSDRCLVYEPFNYEPLREANRIVYGRAEIPDYRLDQCDFLLSFGADFLETWLSPVKLIGRFAKTRLPSSQGMSKLVYVGPRLSLTGLNADEYFLVRPGEERELALSLDHRFAVLRPGLSPHQVAARIGIDPARILQLSIQLQRAKRPLVLAGAPTGGRAETETAIAANLLNIRSRSAIDFSRVHALSHTATNAEVASFVAALEAGEIEALVILGANPAYSLSPTLRFAEALQRVPTVISITPYRDETAELATWVLPADTPLESWGDYEPETGVKNLLQPTMGRRLSTRAPGDILLDLLRAAQLPTPARTYQDYLRSRWSDTDWEAAAQRGGQWTETTSVATPWASYVDHSTFFSEREQKPGPALWTYPSPLLHDGRSANKRWLQEIQDPVTHVVWDSWVEVHPDTARELKLDSGQVVELATPAGKVRASVFLYKGIAPGVLALPFGQGHTAYGRYAAGRGANAFQLGRPDGGWAEPPSRSAYGGPRESPLQVSPLPETARLVGTDGSYSQHGRDLVEKVRLSALPHLPAEEIRWPLPEGYDPRRDLYPGHPHHPHRWAMAVDLSRCVSCETCMAACYAENNVAIVGQEWVSQGREMYWLRLTRYFDWGAPQPATFLPMFCQHCDAAPCEPVCPTFASAHTEEGLNQQVYNRCIGTRYCNNNCPYKVRRFNWRNYDWPESLTWQLNPDVTVRIRGVMEKCTFCVQRIRDLEHLAAREGREVRDGEVIPACVQACPAGAFTFGDLMDPRSQISRLVRDNPRAFQVLPDLNTKPAVIYLKKIVHDGEAV